MLKEARGFGSTIDEAKENAIANLNASDFDDIQFEVISMPKKKVLGLFGGSRAEVRAFVELADKKPSAKNGKRKNKTEKSAAKRETVSKPQESVPVTQKEEAVEKTVKSAEPREAQWGEYADEADIDAQSPTGKAIAYVKSVLSAVGCKEITVKAASRENASLIHIDGEDLSIIIGRRGETLDSLQYLAGLAANNGGGHYRISLDVGNYREKREETLTVLANRIAAQVLKTGKSRSLEPMNPYERRVIHTAVQSIDGVVSNSFGDGFGRRVVISPEGAEVRPPKFNDRRRDGYRRGGNGQRRTSQAVNSSPAREPKRDSDVPLYGKIN